MKYGFAAVVRFVVLPVLAASVLAAGADAQVQFQQPQVVKTGNWPVFVATADVNADGIPDLIYIDAGATAAASTTHVLLGDGKGGFKESAQLFTAGKSVAIGDLTGHGHVDIAWVSGGGGEFNGAEYIAVGTGTGAFNVSFSPGNIPGDTVMPAYVTAVKLHDSGPADVVVEDPGTNLVYCLPYSGLGGGGFRTTIPNLSMASLPSGTGPISFADLNNDGHLDLIVNGLNGFSAQVFLGSGAGIVLPAKISSTFAGTSGVHSLLVKDVNQDGKPDLIAEGAAGHIDVFFGNGDGTFQATSAGGTGPVDGTTGNGGHLIAAADLNHDGQLDAVAATPAGMSVLLGGGTQYLKLQGIYNAGPGGSSYATADFNGDGFLDVALDSPEGIAILYGNADGGFQSSKAYAAGRPALSGTLGKFTTSGKLDAVVGTAATQAQMLFGAGDGTFTAAPAPTTTLAGLPGLVGTVLAGDFNGDGNLDIAMTADGATPPSTANGLEVQFGDGRGGFGPVTPLTAPLTYLVPTNCQPPINHFPGIFIGTSAVADFNGDGIADIANLDVGAYRVMRGVAGSVPVVSFYEGDTSAGGYIDCDLDAHDQVIAGDLSGHGHPDLIFQDEGSLELFLNDGTGNFNYAGDLSSKGGTLITPGSMQAPSLNGTFGGISDTFGFPAFLGSSAVADLDGDGNNDLIVAYDNLSADHRAPSGAAPNYVYIWFGSGGGRFLTSAKHPVNPVRFSPGRNYYQIVATDLNGDGIPDLAMSDGYVLGVQYGNGDGTFQAEQHFLAGQGLNTISAGDVNGDGSVDLVVANGGALFGNPVGNKDLVAVNPDVDTGGITVLLNAIHTKVVTGSLTAAPEPSGYGAPFTLTAALAVPTGGVAATGTVAFSVDGTSVGTAAVSGAGAMLAVPSSLYGTLVPGKHTLSGAYSGDANYAADNGLSGTHTVSLAPTTVTLTPTTALQLYYGQAADGTFAFTLVDPSNHPATGTYTLKDNGVAVASCTNLPVTVRCPYGNPQLLDVGVHAFTVVYNGDAFNAPATSAPVTYTVIPDITTGTLTTSLTQAAPGQAVTLSAALAGNYAVPLGPAVFLDGAAVLSSVTLDAKGAAVLTTSTLALGLHVITVSYAATLDFNAAVTNSVSVLIKQPPTPLAVVVNLVSSVNPSVPGQPVTFTASVTTPGPFITVPVGSVTFLDGATNMGTGAIDQYGVARFTTSSLTAGSHPMTASFAGSAGSGPGPTPGPPQPPVTNTRRVLRAQSQTAGTAPAVSSVLTQVVTNALPAAASGFVLTVSPVLVIVGAGRTAVLLANVQALGGFPDAVTLTCSGLPTETACTFLLATIPPGGGSTTLQLSTMAPHDCDSAGSPYFLGNNAGLPRGLVAAPVLAALAILFVPGSWRRRRRIQGLLALVAAAGLIGLNGCGRCTDLGTKPGTYSFTVTGTASGETQSQVVPMTVTIP